MTQFLFYYIQGATCDFVLTWRKQDAGSNMVKFEMFGSLADNQGYIALGLATTDKMVSTFYFNI